MTPPSLTHVTQELRGSGCFLHDGQGMVPGCVVIELEQSLGVLGEALKVLARAQVRGVSANYARRGAHWLAVIAVNAADSAGLKHCLAARLVRSKSAHTMAPSPDRGRTNTREK